MFSILLCSLNCGGGLTDYSIDLPNGYRYIKTFSEYEGRLISNPKKLVILRHIAELSSRGDLVFGCTKIPEKYFPIKEYSIRYFIIDTKNHLMSKELTKSQWLEVLAKYGITEEPPLTKPTRFYRVMKTGANEISFVQDERMQPINSVEEQCASEPLVDINTASALELQKLHGLGPITAEAICYEREKNGPYSSLSDVAMRIDKITLDNVAKWEGRAICIKP